MKYTQSILALALIFQSSFSLGQTTPTTTPSTTAMPTPTTYNTSTTEGEAALNQKLRDNAIHSAEIIDSQQKGAAPTLQIFGGKGGASTTSATTTSKTNLTDQEKQLSENYVDQAKANAIIKEKCVGEMAQACLGEEVDHKVMGMSPALMKMITQAYATIGISGDFLAVHKGAKESGDTATQQQGQGQGQGTSSNGGATTPETANNGGTTAAEGKKSNEKADDYCKYIPAATETIAAFSQSQAIKDIDKQIPGGGDTAQKDGLLKAAKSHDSRAKQAQIQAVGWYGGAACYAVKAWSGAFAVDTNLVVKIGAGVLLGTFYQSEVANNKEYAAKTRAIAELMPGKGDCNPVTQSDCYCAEPEHANDPTYCKKQIEERQAAAQNFTRVACTDANLKIDPNCECNKTNTCFDKIYEAGNNDLKLGLGYTNSPFKPIASLARGKLEGGSIGGPAYAQTAALAKKALNEFGNKIPITSPLTKEQKDMADAAISKGIPANVARLMALNSPPASAIKAAEGKIAGNDFQVASYSGSGRRNNVVDFSGGNGLGIGGRKQGSKGSGAEEFLGKIAPGKGNQNNGKILEFAAKAQARASQITKDDGRQLFEIISIRYQTSGRRLLQVEGN